MKYFKIKNLTNTFEKRQFNVNTPLDITYIDSMVKKSKRIFPDETLYLQLSTLPLSIHKMRINGLVAVSEITKDEFLFEQKKLTQKKVVKPKEEKPKTRATKETKSTGRKYGKKKDDDVEKEKDTEKEDVKVDVVDE